MSDVKNDAETEDYVPVPAEIMDGCALIFDPLDFEAEFNCFAAIVRDGQLFVLDRDTRQWLPAEREQKKTALRPVK